MAGERELGSRGEDPHGVAVSACLGHERRLRESDLSGDGLHGLGGQIDRIRHDAELVAGQRTVGEHVDEVKRDAHARHGRRDRDCGSDQAGLSLLLH